MTVTPLPFRNCTLDTIGGVLVDDSTVPVHRVMDCPKTPPHPKTRGRAPYFSQNCRGRYKDGSSSPCPCHRCSWTTWLLYVDIVERSSDIRRRRFRRRLGGVKRGEARRNPQAIRTPHRLLISFLMGGDRTVARRLPRRLTSIPFGCGCVSCRDDAACYSMRSNSTPLCAVLPPPAGGLIANDWKVIYPWNGIKMHEWL